MAAKFTYRPCSGCYETVDGQHRHGWYHWDHKRACWIGMGCHECRWRGFRREYHLTKKEVARMQKISEELDREYKKEVEERRRKFLEAEREESLQKISGLSAP